LLPLFELDPKVTMLHLIHQHRKNLSTSEI
jgi:hypothetical protein